MGRGIVIALALSLAANVFLGGFVAGRMAGGPHHRDGAPAFSMRRDGPDGFSDLTPAARDSLRRAFKARRAASREQFRAARELHEEFVDILGADVYDRAAAEALAAKFEAADNFGRAGMARLIVDAADGLSMEDRKSLAEHIDRRGGHWIGARRHRGGEAPGEENPPTE